MPTTFFLHRPDIEMLEDHGLDFKQTWEVVDYFEKQVAEFFGAPYAVAVDCCTHGLELSLVLNDINQDLKVPAHTYMSVPMMLDKLRIKYNLVDLQWQEYYHLTDTIIDAATLWKKDSYIPGSLTSISFQFKKHLPIGRGGMILLDNKEKYDRLQRMVRDGRNPKVTQFEDDVEELGYHYYMTPEDAARGINLFLNLCTKPSKTWSWADYRDLREMTYFKGK